MNYIIQILFLLLTWFNLSATPEISKVGLPNNAVSFSKTENQEIESEVKIGVSNFARSGISEISITKKAVLQDNDALFGASRMRKHGGVSGAGKAIYTAAKPKIISTAQNVYDNLKTTPQFFKNLKLQYPSKYNQFKEYFKKTINKNIDEITDGVNTAGRIRTLPSKLPNSIAIPRGSRTVISEGLDDATRTSLIRENDAADILAKKGYDIEQNPSMPNTNKNPDYKIEGEVFDCYSPFNSNKSVRNIWSEVKGKIDAGQTERVVINLKNWDGEISNLQKQFTDYPVPNLKELMVIDKNNLVSHIEL